MDRDLNVLVRIIRRLRSEDDGFTIVEVMAAAFILLIAILSTAYTATIGFTYSARARQKQEATAVMNQVLEEAEAISDTALLEGLLTSDLCTNDASTITGTPYIVGCGGTTPTYGGETIVRSSPVASSFLNPHVVTTTQGSVDFTRFAYLTYTGGDTSGDELRLTVIVEWGDGQILTTDKVLETTTGCPVDTLHPQGGPCGALIDAAASIPAGEINIVPNGSNSRPMTDGGPPTLPQAANNQMSLRLPEITVDLLAEQAALVTGSTDSSGASLDYMAGGGAGVLTTLNCGQLSFASSASDVEDTDVKYSAIPDTAAGADDYECQSTSGGLYDQANLTFPVGATTGQRVVVTKGTSVDLPTTGRTISTTNAGDVVGATTYNCNSETNSKPCAYASMRINSALYANLADLGGTISTGSGSCYAVQAQTQSTGSSAFVTKQTTGDGFVRLTITRTFPNITIGCLPSGMVNLPTLISWSNFNIGSTRIDPVTGTPRGYLFRLEGYSESVTLEAGPGGSTATPTATRTGTLRYWNGASNSYLLTPIGTSSTSVTIPALNTGCMSQGVVAMGTPPGTQVIYSGTASSPFPTPITWTIPTPTITKDTAAGTAAADESVSFPDPLGGTTIYGYHFAGSSGCTGAGSVSATYGIVGDLNAATADVSYG